MAQKPVHSAGVRKQGPAFAWSKFLSGCCREPWVGYLSYRYWSNDRAPGFKTDCWLESSRMISRFCGFGTTQRPDPLERAPLAKDCFDYSNRPQQCQTRNLNIKADFAGPV